ncbi:MAG: hypothetical protein CBC48_10515 [bacterium TMED88]|nr:MAG: hypothetical protein CBC48_10515 [bacterium TMED88]
MTIKHTRWDVIKSREWDHLAKPWDDFLDSIDGHWKKMTWRDRKREDAIRIVFVVIGNFVHLYHNDALLCYCKFKELDLAGGTTEALTAFPINQLDYWRQRLLDDGHTVITI